MMKLNRFLAFLFGVAVTILVVGLLWQVRSLRNETSFLQVALAKEKRHVSPGEPPVELAEVMTRLQRHANKLYFAGKLQNWALATFYLEEIEETVKDIASKEIMEGQINISGLMQGLILPEVENLEAAVKQRDVASFQKQYRALTFSCNACHTTAKHPFIVVTEPRLPAYDNQEYGPPQAALR